MREGWEYKKLGEVASFFRGLTYSGKDEVSFSNNIVLRSNNIDLNTNTINFDELKFISDSIIIPKDKKLKKNSIFMCMSNGSKLHLGKVAFIDKEYPYAFGGFMGLIVPKEDELMPKMAYYYFCSQKFKTHLSSIGNGANINNIKFVDIAKDTIPIPPKSTQLTIVSELDKINELIRLKKEQLKDYDNLAQSIFYEMFGDPVENEKGWEVKKLGEISSLICNGNTPKGGSEVYVKEGFLFLRSQNVWKNRIDLEDVAYIDESTHLSLKKSILKHNDLLITKTGRINTENSSLGRTALFEGGDGSANINGHVYLVRLKENMVHKYILYILISNSYRELIRKTCVGGIDKRQLNKDHIEDFPIIFPPIELQKIYSNRVSIIERQKSAVQKSITDLETLLASRMQYWFE